MRSESIEFAVEPRYERHPDALFGHLDARHRALREVEDYAILLPDARVWSARQFPRITVEFFALMQHLLHEEGRERESRRGADGELTVVVVDDGSQLYVQVTSVGGEGEDPGFDAYPEVGLRRLLRGGAGE